MNKKGSYKRSSICISHLLRGLAGFMLLLWPFLSFSQTTMLIYDGITGLKNVAILNDTAVIETLIPGSPADKAGLKPLDRIISIDDSLVAGTGMNSREILQLIRDRSGKSIDLKIKRDGEAQPLAFTFQRDPYLFQIDSYDYMYLVDSTEKMNISDILLASQDTLFKDPLDTKITVYAVEKGSPAEKSGILAGDKIISLADEVDAQYDYHIGHDRLHTISSDTSITLLREDSLIYLFPGKPSEGDLRGITSQFEKDISYSCLWLKIATESRLSATRTYLFKVPGMKGKDSLNFFYKLPAGEIVEKESGILLPLEDRDFIYKDWHAVQATVNKDENQTFYLRWKAEDRVSSPSLQAFAHDTIVRYDRFERMVLFGFLFIILIISAFFLLLFAVTRGWQYLHFALYIGSVAIFLFISDGYLDEFFWKENNLFLKFLEKFQPYIMSWISIFFLLFGIAYLELRKKLNFWYKSVVVVLSLTGIRILLVLFEVLFNLSYPAFLNDIVRIVWIFTVGIIPLFILIVPAVLRIRNGYRPAWYFLIANVVLIPLIYVTIYDALSSSTVPGIYESIPGRLFLSSAMYIAAILQILTFSFGIAQKIRLDEIEKKRIQEQIIEQLKVNEKLKDQVNRELEQKVQERTREISEQKEEIESQRDEIEEQRNLVASQRDMVSAQKKEITDSIDYAQRIQLAVLPGEEYLGKIMPEHFVIYKPKDVVSGDFYWIKEVDNSLIIVVADCTGHGVPGAFMSMLGITLLDEMLAKRTLDPPGKILDNLRIKVKEMLVKRGDSEEQKDGLDMAIAIVDRKKKVLQFAGANNSLYLIREGRHLEGTEPGDGVSLAANGSHLFELKGDRQPIGFYWEETEFTTHPLELKQEDSLYVFTDGYVDQFGGKNRKKFKNRRFKELLLSLQKESMEKQKQILEDSFENWRGEFEQTDDVCIVGLRPLAIKK